jgi:hypothetical protein
MSENGSNLTNLSCRERPRPISCASSGAFRVALNQENAMQRNKTWSDFSPNRQFKRWGSQGLTCGFRLRDEISDLRRAGGGSVNRSGDQPSHLRRITYPAHIMQLRSLSCAPSPATSTPSLIASHSHIGSPLTRKISHPSYYYSRFRKTSGNGAYILFHYK